MLIIGVSGGTGSGKTTVVNQIVKQVGNDAICVISQDSYYKVTDYLTPKERATINFDHPNAIDFKSIIKHLKALKSGTTIHQPVYSFLTHNRTKETVTIQPKKVVIVEGILIFSNTELRNLFDIKIFVDTETDERLIRRIKRDILERGRNLDEVLQRYQSTLKPMHQQFIAPTKKFADIIIPNNNHSNIAIDVLKTFIKKRL